MSPKHRKGFVSLETTKERLKFKNDGVTLGGCQLVAKS